MRSAHNRHQFHYAGRTGTRALAATPARYHVSVFPTRPFLALPEVSSERRDYMPIAYLEPPTVPSNLVRVLPDAALWLFGLLTSRMHMAWLRLDSAVERLYRPASFPDDRARAESLLTRYEALSAPLLAAPPSRRKR